MGPFLVAVLIPTVNGEVHNELDSVRTEAWIRKYGFAFLEWYTRERAAALENKEWA